MGGGTTIREIREGVVNINLGPGPKPTLEGFLEALREPDAS